MYYVKKRLEISASHQLHLSYESKCENLHGHNWIITVYCRAKDLNRDGMVIDFSVIKNAIKENSIIKTSTIYCRSIRQQRIWQGGFANRFHAATKSKCKNRKTTPPVMKKINEIFYSLQGEGFWSGTPIIFIRFSGCNLRCDFCDTEHYSHTEMSDAKIIDRIKKRFPPDVYASPEENRRYKSTVPLSTCYTATAISYISKQTVLTPYPTVSTGLQ